MFCQIFQDDVLPYPEISKEEFDDLNQMVEPIEKFFTEGSKYTIWEPIEKFFTEGSKYTIWEPIEKFFTEGSKYTIWEPRSPNRQSKDFVLFQI